MQSYYGLFLWLLSTFYPSLTAHAKVSPSTISIAVATTASTQSLNVHLTGGGSNGGEMDLTATLKTSGTVKQVVAELSDLKLLKPVGVENDVPKPATFKFDNKLRLVAKESGPPLDLLSLFGLASLDLVKNQPRSFKSAGKTWSISGTAVYLGIVGEVGCVEVAGRLTFDKHRVSVSEVFRFSKTDGRLISADSQLEEKAVPGKNSDRFLFKQTLTRM